MSRNPNHGIAPKTTKRQATHGPALSSRVRCPCGCRHTMRTQSKNGTKLGSNWCALCGQFFTPTEA